MQVNQVETQEGYINYVVRLKEYLSDPSVDRSGDTSDMVYEGITDSVRKKLEMLNVENWESLLWSIPLDKHNEGLFYIDLLLFIAHSEDMIRMVASAALKRKAKGIAALNEQNTQEQLHHCIDHLNNWMRGDCGDEATAIDQAKHTVCRALLAYFTLMQEEAKKNQDKVE